MELSYIIVNYNTEEHIKRCLDSIQKFSGSFDYEIIVVDNNSSSREIEKFPDLYKNVSFYFRNENGGFGSGCNYGADRAKGKYLVFVNPDIIFTSDVMNEMMRFMETHPLVGLCSGAFTNFDDELGYSYNNFPGLRWEFKEAAGMGIQSEINMLTQVLTEYSKEKKILEVDWIYGACMLIRAELFEKLSGFDDSFFLYYEDVDLQVRIRNAGYKIVCFPYLHIRHFTNSSVRSDEGENLYFFHMHRSRLLYMYKHFTFVKRNISRLMHLNGIVARYLFLYLRPKFSGKRSRKSAQYRQMFRLYFSGEQALLGAKFN